MYRLRDGKKVHFVNVFDLDNVEKLKEFQQTVTNQKGVVYAIEIDNVVKIGCTRFPYNRVKTHVKNYSIMANVKEQKEIKFGTIVMTDPCFNYYALENKLHEKFKNLRIKGTELFHISLDNVVLEMAKQFKCDEVDNHQVEVLFSNLLNQLQIEVEANGSMLAGFAQALVNSGNQLAKAEARISELEEVLLLREQTN